MQLLHPYNPEWEDQFNAIRSTISQALEGLPVAIEHIGSTAVPGLAAKPIIDIDIVYDEVVPFAAIQSALEQLGYYHNGNQGIAGREVFKRSSLAQVHEVLDRISHHLYVCPANSPELRRHIMFRDALLANETARRQYQALKYEIATEAGQDRKRYAALKETRAKAFVEGLIRSYA